MLSMARNHHRTIVPLFTAAAALAWQAPGATSHASPAASAAPVGQPATVSEAVRLVPAADGNEVRYRVREQLARIEFPSDAVGATTAVTGALVLAADGSIVRDASRFEVDLTTIESDNARRDNYVRRNTLVTAEFPSAIFEPTALQGVSLPLPVSGEQTLRISGNLTLRGVTRAVTWDVTARAEPDGFSGTASTEFRFGDFEMPIPRVAAVLSVRDLIRLEYDFRLVRAPAVP